MVANKIMFSLISWLITIHFGKNPINGGIPASDKKFIMNNSLKFFSLFIELINWFI